MRMTVSDADSRRVQRSGSRTRPAWISLRHAWSDLHRGIAAAAKEMGLDACSEYIAGLICVPSGRKS